LLLLRRQPTPLTSTADRDQYYSLSGHAEHSPWHILARPLPAHRPIFRAVTLPLLPSSTLPLALPALLDVYVVPKTISSFSLICQSLHQHRAITSAPPGASSTHSK